MSKMIKHKNNYCFNKLCKMTRISYYYIFKIYKTLRLPITVMIVLRLEFMNLLILNFKILMSNETFWLEEENIR